MVALSKDMLVGTFRLVSLEARRSDGEISHPFGDAPIGVFIFDPDGNFAVQLMDPDRTSGGATPAGNAHMAMFGTYRVDGDQQTFTLTPDGATHPALIGSEVLRYVDFRDGLAIFNTPTQEVDGLETTTYITWRKVSPT